MEESRVAYLIGHRGIRARGEEEGLVRVVGAKLLLAAEIGLLQGKRGDEGLTHGRQRPHLSGGEAMSIAFLIPRPSASQQRVTLPRLVRHGNSEREKNSKDFGFRLVNGAESGVPL